MINPRARRRRSGRKLRHVHIKIRLTKVGEKPEHEEVLNAVDFVIANGDAPIGWTLESRDWNPNNIGVEGVRNILEAWRDSLDVAIVQTEGSSRVAGYEPLTLWEMRERLRDSGLFTRREIQKMRYWGSEKLSTALAFAGAVYEEEYPDFEWEVEIVAEVDT